MNDDDYTKRRDAAIPNFTSDTPSRKSAWKAGADWGRADAFGDGKTAELLESLDMQVRRLTAELKLSREQDAHVAKELATMTADFNFQHEKAQRLTVDVAMHARVADGQAQELAALRAERNSEQQSAQDWNAKWTEALAMCEMLAEFVARVAGITICESNPASQLQWCRQFAGEALSEYSKWKAK